MRVDLSGYGDIGLIIKAKTGVMHTSQVGGLLCEHPEVEGFFVPLRSDRLLESIDGALRSSPYVWGEREAEALDRQLRRHDFGWIRVDRSLLHESTEAWVHVLVSARGERSVPITADSTIPLPAVLVWPNSD